ncbi:nicotinamide riboside transporter PnuC [Xanthomonas fragariae]|uniref:Nicotinamide riboside transporter PnuC n=1 Tax=Xanthomonas fragariae TaxID=48664 RepID=A0A1Y6HCR2_9XANT|nr:nicotinamide riboside transporter PnuC [Xanthomonas fragariae]AOD14105.1 aminotransferase [Xanthomonas fragariae]AOD17489.1 aminotransferase [Xanthomonas fragariae]ENZ94384.1 PnuC protein [Xanthomonas fragariae LMG 25863]MBL9197857.1 nicotinamide mononucleotide transporter [Xanthomonas fragariae]MBL9219964.1 nicotinamide mononucleotide transporter [Xanthomonas fragariae]
MSLLESIAVVINLLGVWLTARRIYWCWPVGIVAVALYAWLFYRWKLYSDMLLQGVYVLTQLYGWWHWQPGTAADGTAADMRIRPLPIPRAELWVWLCIGAAFAAALGTYMHHRTDAALPWLDAALASFSLVASVWAARKRIANWVLWIVLDCIYVGVFASKGLYPTALLYAGFVLLAVYGWRSWKTRQNRNLAGAS